MIPSSYPDASEIARLSARMLLEIKAVHLMPRIRLHWPLACPAQHMWIAAN